MATNATHNHSFSFRIFLIALISTLCCCSLTACSQSHTDPRHATQSASSADKKLRDTTFMLSWTPDTNHIGVYVAQAKGWFEQAGLNVNIVGVAQAGAEQAVNSGLADFALSNMANLGVSSTQGVRLTQVLQVQQKPSAIWCALASNTDIKRPRDLDGTTFATFGSNEDYAVVKRMIQNDGGRGEFDTVTVGTSTFQVLAAGKADFGGFYSTWEGVQASMHGPKLTCFDEPTYGIPGNANAIGVITKQSTVSKDPDFVKAFVQAAQRGYEYAYSHPHEAAQILVDEAPEANLELDFVQASMDFILNNHYWGDPDAIKEKTFTLGTADFEGTQAYYDFLAKAGTYEDSQGNPITQAPQSRDLATNTFLAH